MAEIIRNRTIRPSSRLSTSSYKVDTKEVSINDTLIVNIKHKDKPFHRICQFDGKSIANKNSIHFEVVRDSGNDITIKWIGVNPMSTREITDLHIK
jgi:hypothetical protein